MTDLAGLPLLLESLSGLVSFKISLQIDVRKVRSEPPGKGVIAVTQDPGVIPRRKNRAGGLSTSIPGIASLGDSVHRYFVQHRDKRNKAHQEAAGM